MTDDREGPRRVWMLAGHIRGKEEADALRRLKDRLERLGWRSGALALSGPTEGWSDESGFIKLTPDLGNPWTRAWATRRLAREHPAPGASGRDDPRRADEPRRPDLLHVLSHKHADIGLALAEALGVRYALSVNEFLMPGARLRLSRELCRGVLSAHAALTRDLVETMGVPAEAVRTLPPGVEVPERGRVPRSAGEGGVAVVGTASKLGEGSGIGTFLNAARRLLDRGVDAEFLIHVIGKGGAEGETRRRADKLKLGDRLTLTSEHAWLENFWGALDIYCQTTEVPTVGHTMLRAMARGLPVVVTNVPGARDHVVDGVSGRVVPEGNSEALAGVVLELLGDAERAARLGEAARAHARDAHDPEKFARGLAEAYRDALESENSPLAGLTRSASWRE